VSEWWCANRDLISKAAQGPPVHREAVALFVNDLRRKILRRSAKRVRLHVALQMSCQAEIREVQVAILIQQDIFWLKIPMNKVVIVEVAKGKDELSNEEAGISFIESSLFAEVVE
jgi:hypothetical protein